MAAVPGVPVDGVDAPPRNIALVTPSDSVDLVNESRAISFGTVGAIKVTTSGGQTIVIPSGALAAGVQHAMIIKRIWSTSTTAADIVMYW